MKRFILRLLLFCCLPLGVLIPLGYMVDAGLHKSRNFMYAEWNDIFEGHIQADMLIMGSSRAWVHFSPRILDSVLGVNSYNLGMDGTSADLQFERLKIYMRYNKAPKYILQEVGLNSITTLARNLPHYQQFLPYLSDSAVWRVYKNGYKNVSVADRYFPLYKYNNQLPTIKEGILSYMGRSGTSAKYKGYEGQLRYWDSSYGNFIRNNPQKYALDVMPEAIARFKEYIHYCKDHNIKLIFVYAPFYYKAADYIANLNEVIGMIKELSVEYDVPYMDYTHNFLDSSTTYFYNSQHLNKEGSEIFSNMIAQDLKPMIAPAAK